MGLNTNIASNADEFLFEHQATNMTECEKSGRSEKVRIVTAKHLSKINETNQLGGLDTHPGRQTAKKTRN